MDGYNISYTNNVGADIVRPAFFVVKTLTYLTRNVIIKVLILWRNCFMQCEKCGKKVFANETCECGQKAPKKNNGGVRANTVICFIRNISTTFRTFD